MNEKENNHVMQKKQPWHVLPTNTIDYKTDLE